MALVVSARALTTGTLARGATRCGLDISETMEEEGGLLVDVMTAVVALYGCRSDDEGVMGCDWLRRSFRGVRSCADRVDVSDVSDMLSGKSSSSGCVGE